MPAFGVLEAILFAVDQIGPHLSNYDNDIRR
jgi:hypothetical protein